MEIFYEQREIKNFQFYFLFFFYLVVCNFTLYFFHWRDFSQIYFYPFFMKKKNSTTNSSKIREINLHFFFQNHNPLALTRDLTPKKSKIPQEMTELQRKTSQESVQKGPKKAKSVYPPKFVENLDLRAF